MKRILSYWAIFCCAACGLAACVQDDDPADAAGGDSIRLGVSGIERMTRAESTAVESRVDRLDVLIFDAAGVKRHYERVSAGGVSQGVVTLRARRTDFEANADYWVYLIANTSHPEADFEALTTREGLQTMTQRDANIHMTGLPEVQNAPRAFLMDGIAYPKGASAEPAAPAPVKLYDGVRSNDTELMVTLRRAAAKIVVRIRKGASITFDDYEAAAGHGCGYYLRNMPISTSLVAEAQQNAEVATPGKNSAGYFQGGIDDDKSFIGEVRVTAYAYSHDWDGRSALDWEPRLVVNLPMWYHGREGEPGYNPDREDDNFHANSYYQIPICRPSVKRLERNRCYEVTVEVNAAGATDASEPVELGPIRYSVRDWEEQTIGIGGETERPHYLMVNTDSMEMHNMADDDTTLEFASSSKVTVTPVEAWYFDKNDDRQSVDVGSAGITATPDEGLSGHIKVHSPVPTNNAPRYVKLKVENEDGSQPREIVIVQYPLEYITNIHGWYSYRDDFNGGRTNWEYLDGIPAEEVEGQSYDSQQFSSEKRTTSNSLFKSKAVDNSGGISRYAWEQNGSGWWGNNPPYTYRRTFDNVDNNDNFRMYHVRITASSGEYTLGRPRLNDEGNTDRSSENSVIVSPSFLIASQLGTTSATSARTTAEEHCKQYVEVYKTRDASGKEVTRRLTDWRLPTHYEVGIILRFQNSSAAMDEVMSGDYYWSASGRVARADWENLPESGSANIRCIHDAYDIE